MGINIAPFETVLSTVCHGQLASSFGLSAFSSTQWGTTFAAAAQFPTAAVAQNQASNSFAEFAIPSGAQSCIIHTLRWTDGGSCDVFGKSRDGRGMVEQS